MKPSERDVALHTTTKKDHRNNYRPSRKANHCQTEKYLRPTQLAQSVFFEYVDDYKKPTIRSVHDRRLHDLLPPKSHHQTPALSLSEARNAATKAIKANEEFRKAEAILKEVCEERDYFDHKYIEATAWSKRCTKQYKEVAAEQIKQAYDEKTVAGKKEIEAKKYYEYTKEMVMKWKSKARQHIEMGTILELENRISKNFNKVNILLGELEGIEVEEIQHNDDHILSSSLPGSPRKYRGPKRQTALEIIEKRKKKLLVLKKQNNSNEKDPSELQFQKEQKERAEKRRLGLERQERCWMCHSNYPKGTMQDEVIKKCIYKWRQLQKTVRYYKKLIRVSIKSLGEGGAAIVFRFANKSNNEPVIKSNKVMSMIKKAKNKFLKLKSPSEIHSGSSQDNTLNYQRRPPARKNNLKNNTSITSLQQHGESPRKLREKKKIEEKLKNATQFKRASPGSITFDQFFQAIYQMFSITIVDAHVKEELLKWLDRDQGGDISFSEFSNLVKVGNDPKHEGKEQYLATPGSERRPQLILEELDNIQTEMIEMPMRLMHTLYEKVQVCGFCMQLLHQSAFRDSDDEVTSNKGSRINNQTEKDDQRIERDEIHHNHKKILPTTFTTRHNPWGWNDIRKQILDSFIKRNVVTPFETYQEHKDVGLHVKHYMSFNCVPTPSRKCGRPPVRKEITLASTLKNENEKILTNLMLSGKIIVDDDIDKDSVVDEIVRQKLGKKNIRKMMKNSMEMELENLYKAYKKSGKSLDYYEHSANFKDAEERFYIEQGRALNTSLLKKRGAIMATDKDLEKSASKLQAIIRGRALRKAESEKREKIKKEKEIREKNEKNIKLKNYRNHREYQSASKLQAFMRGRSSRKKTLIEKYRKKKR